MYEVRAPLEIELPAIITMGETMHKQSAFAHMDFNKGRMLACLSNALEHSDRFFFEVILEKQHGSVVGVLWGGLQDNYFGSDVIASDLLLYITEEHRGHTFPALQRLVANYREWAIKHNARRIFLVSTSGIQPEKTEKLFEFLGFRRVGTVHEA